MPKMPRRANRKVMKRAAKLVDKTKTEFGNALQGNDQAAVDKARDAHRDALRNEEAVHYMVQEDERRRGTSGNGA